MMRIAFYECGVILFMLGLCWGSALHSEMDNEIKHDSERWGLKRRSYTTEEQPCPTWYLETKHNTLTRCVRVVTH